MKKMMQPIRTLAGNATRLLISPDGALNLIPFEALVDEQGQYLVEHYAFSYLTSGRDLLRLQVARASKSNPLVIANPSFGEPISPQQIAQTNAVKVISFGVSRRSNSSSKRSVTTGGDLSDVYFAPLGNTAQEARSIRAIYPRSKLIDQSAGDGIRAQASRRAAHSAYRDAWFFSTKHRQPRCR
ncbi:MAG: CHAT domain-containing protein [Pyrinomonadaceae bacterium]